MKKTYILKLRGEESFREADRILCECQRYLYSCYKYRTDIFHKKEHTVLDIHSKNGVPELPEEAKKMLSPFWEIENK